MADRHRTEAEKRKQDDDVSRSRRKKKARDDDGEVTAATEEEVEEFYAILRRINDAVKYFKKGRHDSKWLREMLEGVHNEEDDDGVKGQARREQEGVEENVGFDLNADPGP